MPRLLYQIMSEQPLQVRADEGGGRLDKYMADRIPELSRSLARRLIDSGQVTVNGEPVRASYKVRHGDLVIARLPAEEAAELVAEPIALHVVYEDESLLVVDKAAGMVVHPAPGHPAGTLVNALLARCPELAQTGDDRPGIVHRLDRDTSGLILVAKGDKVRRSLQRQFKERQVLKVYLALLHGHLQPHWGRIEAPIGRDPRHRQRMAILPGAREAITEYHVLRQLADQGCRLGPTACAYSLVEAEPQTGRTHQIRVHFASIGHPVVGDPVYGRRRQGLAVPRQFLHAHRLSFKHPVSGRRMELEAPLPADLTSVLAQLKNAPYTGILYKADQ
jgi:23S rRNA pseudouridine1911/1915/1917 synthase